MKIEDISKRRNELLKRNDIKFIAVHSGSTTPSRVEIKHKLAAKLDVDKERIYLIKMQTKKGSMSTIGRARVYDNVEQANFVEPEYIRLRNKVNVNEKE